MTNVPIDPAQPRMKAGILGARVTRGARLTTSDAEAGVLAARVGEWAWITALLAACGLSPVCGRARWVVLSSLAGSM